MKAISAERGETSGDLHHHRLRRDVRVELNREDGRGGRVRAQHCGLTVPSLHIVTPMPSMAVRVVTA